jgi:Domain of unknown function (DUF5658)
MTTSVPPHTAPTTSNVRHTREQLAVAKTQPLPAIEMAAAHSYVARRGAHEQALARPRTGGTPLLVWLGIFGLLNGADILSTWVGLANGMREGNPLMSALLGNYGFGALIGYKLAVVVAVSAGVLLLRSFSSHIARMTIRICAVLVALVVLTNVLQFIASK